MSSCLVRALTGRAAFGADASESDSGGGAVTQVTDGTADLSIDAAWSNGRWQQAFVHLKTSSAEAGTTLLDGPPGQLFDANFLWVLFGPPQTHQSKWGDDTSSLTETHN